MGVKGWNIFKPDTYHISILNGSTIGIDAYYVVKRYSSRSIGSVKYSLISGVLYFVLNLLENGALPIFVYDGILPYIKRGHIHDRQYFTNDKSIEIYRSMGTIENIQRDFDYMINITKQLLTALGIQYLTASDEADRLLTGLAVTNQINYVFSTDKDYLAYGIPHLITSIDFQNNNVKIIELKKLLNQYGISQSHLRDLAILCGNDFFSGINGIGPKKGIALLKQYGNLWDVLAELKIRPTSEMVKARKRYELVETREITIFSLSSKENLLWDILSEVMRQDRIKKIVHRLQVIMKNSRFMQSVLI